MLNTGPKTIVFSRNPKAKPIHAVEQLIDILEKEKFKTIIKIDEKDEEKLIEAIQGSTVKHRVH